MLGHPIQLCTRMRRFLLTRINKKYKCTKVPTGRVSFSSPLFDAIKKSKPIKKENNRLWKGGLDVQPLKNVNVLFCHAVDDNFIIL
jgi:hypothetical protein